MGRGDGNTVPKLLKSKGRFAINRLIVMINATTSALDSMGKRFRTVYTAANEKVEEEFVLRMVKPYCIPLGDRFSGVLKKNQDIPIPSPANREDQEILTDSRFIRASVA